MTASPGAQQAPVSAEAPASGSPAQDAGEGTASVMSEDCKFAAELRANLVLVGRGAAHGEKRFLIRALRNTPALRRKLTHARFYTAVTALLPSHQKKSSYALVNWLVQSLANTPDEPMPMEIERPNTTGQNDQPGSNAQTAQNAAQSNSGSPSSGGSGGTSAGLMESLKSSPLTRPLTNLVTEQAVYLGLLVMLLLHDKKSELDGFVVAERLVKVIKAANKRTLDVLAARVYYYYARFAELCSVKGVTVRVTLHELLRTATLRRDVESSATLINILLCSLLLDNLANQAELLVTKSVFPEQASNNQAARYLYYLGRIKAILLDYPEAHRCLLLAARKAPQSAKGFLQATSKIAIVVQLLMGEIPDRNMFRAPHLRSAPSSLPYQHLASCVRWGKLADFVALVNAHAAQFERDGALSLVRRLRQNVLQTGICMIAAAYSRISLRDVCKKLSLASEEDAEYMVAKAIRDGVVSATLDHEAGHMCSVEPCDAYTSKEPLTAFHTRINFCIDLHNESVQAMSYPNNSSQKKIFAGSDELREIEKEIQTHLDEEEGEDF